MVKQTPIRRALALGNTALGVSKAQPDAIPIAKGFKADVNGLVVDGAPSIEAWTSAITKLKVIEKGAQFSIGDCAIWGETHFDERASQVLDPDLGWSERTLSIYQWIASRIAKDDRRMDRLTISHHMLVAALTPAKQREWLRKASADEDDKPWTVGRLRAALKDGEDLPVTDHYILVRCETDEQRAELMDRLEGEGFAVKAVERRRKVEPVTEAA